MEDAFIITGGKPLKGTVTLSGAKNVALKIIIAALLVDGPTTISNVPQIRDIKELLHLLADLRVSAKFTDQNTLIIDPSKMDKSAVDFLHGSKTRVSFMLFAPLLHRFGMAEIPNPGGCRIGARPIDRHIEMMRSFGVTIKYDSNTGFYKATLGGAKLTPSHYRFSKPTHTGTELAVMFAAITEGESIIENAALEPEIDDLINFLNRCGAEIVRTGTEIRAIGKKRLNSFTEPFAISLDRNEAITYAVAGLATKGDIVTSDIKITDISFFVEKLKEAGAGIEETDAGIRFFYERELKAIDITTSPHPGFMTDWQPLWAILMTQARGVATIHETVYDKRFGFVDELRKLGGKFDFFRPEVTDPKSTYQFDIDSPRQLEEWKQAIHVYGPVMLHSGVISVSDLRAGACLVIAAAVARGESVVNGASIIERGYAEIDKKIQNLGGIIRKV